MDETSCYIKQGSTESLEIEKNTIHERKYIIQKALMFQVCFTKMILETFRFEDEDDYE